MSDPIPESAWKEYVNEVFADFLWRTHLPPTRLMGSGEWWVVWKWMRDGIPLRIVLSAMGQVKRRPWSLAYYDGPVRERFAMWRKAVGGWA